MRTAPVLSTARLRLRPHVLDDMAALEAFYATDRAAFMGRPNTRTQLWYGFASEVGSWDLMGHGAWAITTQDGALVGQVAITQPPHFPEREIGWLLFEGHDGKGYATEAAEIFLRIGFEELGLHRVYAELDPRNEASAAVCQRLGMRHEAHLRENMWLKGEWVDTAIYAILEQDYRRIRA